MSKLFEAMEEAHRDGSSLSPSPTPELRVVAPPRADFEAEMLALYRSLDQHLGDLTQKAILFVGVDGGEGTSTVVSSLARLVAERLSRNVAVLDMDIRSPTQHRLFGVDASIGWDDVLKGTAQIEKAIYPTTEERISVVPFSPSRAGSIPVLDAQGMQGIFEVLRPRFDLTLVDCAAAAAFPESITISPMADAVVLVIAAESTRWPSIEAICRQVASAGGEVIGIVLNKRRYYLPRFFDQRL